MKKIIAFSGSNHSMSINQQLITIVAQYVKQAEVEIIDLRDYEAPLYSIDNEKATGFPSSMTALFEKMSSADGFIVASPEHNGSFPAFFKNTIDWLSRMGRKVFNDKPVVFLTASPGGRGGASLLAHLLAIMPHQGAKVIGGHGIGTFHQKTQNGELIDLDDKNAISKLIDQLEESL